MAQGDEDIYRGQVRQNTPLNAALCAIWYRLWQLTGFSASGSGGISVTFQPTTVIPHFVLVSAGSSHVIPAGAIGAGVLITTGTGTLNGVSWPVLVPWNEQNKLSSAVTLQLGATSTAQVYYGTQA